MYLAEGQTVHFANSYVKQIKFGADNKIALSAEPLFEVYAQIPAALSQLVNMQNQILPILQSAFEVKNSVPKSLSSAIKAGITKYNFSQPVCDLINDYWNNGGKYLRDVRDINEHHIALVDYTYYKYEKDPGKILVLLPDNPESKSVKKFTYNNEIDAFETISSGFTQLNNLFEAILLNNNIEPTSFAVSLSLGHMGSLEVEQERTLGMMINITGSESTEKGIKIMLDTIELQQIIPEQGQKGNIAVRKLKPDHEVFKN